MKKKVIACILTLTLAFSLAACGNEKKDDTKETSKTEQRDETDDEDVEDEDIEDEDIEDEELDEDVEDEQAMVEPGTIEGNVYTNASLGVQATIPEEFVLYTEEQIQEVLGVGAEMMEEANYNVDALEEGGTLYEVMAATADGTTNL